MLQKQTLEGTKEMLKFFREHVIEVKSVTRAGVSAAGNNNTAS